MKSKTRNKNPGAGKNNQTWLRYICHQKPNRCFKFHGKTMAICSRCLGVYSGLLIGFLIPVIITIIYSISVNTLLVLMIIGISPMAIDGFTQFMGLRESNNYLRFTSGFIGGFFLGVLFNWLIIHVFFLD